MCHICESQFTEMAAAFDIWLANYREHCAQGCARDTSALRVHDMATAVMEECSAQKTTIDCTAWFLAVAVERLMALEASGIPT